MHPMVIRFNLPSRLSKFTKFDARRKVLSQFIQLLLSRDYFAQLMMNEQGNSVSKSNDVIDLISDEDDEENESQHIQKTLQGLCELASLRSLIPPNFLMHFSDRDFNFFNEELALSLISVSKSKTHATENRDFYKLDLPKRSLPQQICIPTPTTSVSGNIFHPASNGFSNFEERKSSSTIKLVRASKPVLSQRPKSTDNNSRSNDAGVTKLPNGFYRVRQKTPMVENSKETDKDKVVLNGTVPSTSSAPSQSNNLSSGTDYNKEKSGSKSAIASTSIASNQSNSLLTKLTSSKALENLKKNNASAHSKSITINGFTITPTSTVNNSNNTPAPSSETPRRLPPATYSCDKCHEKFRYNVALLDHLSNVHRISVDSVGNDSNNSSSQNTQTVKFTKKRKRSKKENAALKSVPSGAKRQNSKTIKVKRKKSNECSGNVAGRKASMSTEISSEKSSTENSMDQMSVEHSPETNPEPQLLDNTLYSIPKIEKMESSPSPTLNCESSLNDVSDSDNLIMDVTEENESNNTDVESEVDSPSGASGSKAANVDRCVKSFKFLTYYEIEHNDSVRYRCSTCNRTCAAIELVLDHSEKCNGRKSLKCLFPNCPPVTYVPQQLKDHLKNKHNVITHSCKVCKSYFVKPEELKVHRLSCVNSENSQYQCPVEGCKVAYFYEMHFRGHLSRRHKIITIFTCKVCKLLFYDEEDLNSHLKTPAHVAADEERMRRLAEVREKLSTKADEKKAE